MRKPYITISPRSLARALVRAKKAQEITELIVIMAELNQPEEEEEKLPDDINDLKNKLDAALIESAKDDDLDEKARQHDVILK